MMPPVSAKKRASATEPKALKDSPTTRKHQILLAAEKLFSLGAYDSVSMRDIAQEAGLSLALLSYHFGGKLDLLHAIFDYRAEFVEGRLQALREVRAQRHEVDYLEAIVHAFVHQVLELRSHPESRNFMRLVAREVGGGGEHSAEIVKKHFDPLANAFIAAIQEAAPKATRGEVAACYIFALGSLLNATVDERLQRLSRGAMSSAKPDLLEPLLVAFVSSGIRAALRMPATGMARKSARKAPAGSGPAASGKKPPRPPSPAQSKPRARK